MFSEAKHLSLLYVDAVPENDQRLFSRDSAWLPRFLERRNSGSGMTLRHEQSA
jgi:hypothetical protein